MPVLGYKVKSVLVMVGIYLQGKNGSAMGFIFMISALFDTKHAIGITTKDGTELLIHVGVNTVELEGKYYEAHVAQGDEVKPGQLILTFDIQKIQEAGYPVVTPVIIANTDAYRSVEGLKTGEIHCMEPLMKLEER